MAAEGQNLKSGSCCALRVGCPYETRRP
jgi:hypothetical protein